MHGCIHGWLVFDAIACMVLTASWNAEWLQVGWQVSLGFRLGLRLRGRCGVDRRAPGRQRAGLNAPQPWYVPALTILTGSKRGPATVQGKLRQIPHSCRSRTKDMACGQIGQGRIISLVRRCLHHLFRGAARQALLRCVGSGTLEGSVVGIVSVHLKATDLDVTRAEARMLTQASHPPHSFHVPPRRCRAARSCVTLTH